MNSLLRTLLIIAIIGLCLSYFFTRKPNMIHALDIKSPQDAIALFPSSVGQIKSQAKQAIDDAKKELEAIIAIPNDQRTFANTAQALDHLGALSSAAIIAPLDKTLEMVSPNETIRNTARDAVLEIQNFFIDNIVSNRDLYKAFKAYAEGNAKNENLSEQQQYFLTETLKSFERDGLNLPDEQLAQVKTLRKNIAQLELEFDKNIAQDTSSIAVDKKDLEGLSEEFINSLTQKNGKYILTVDYPTYMQVMENCANTNTRKGLWGIYMNRAFPANKKVLEELISSRYQLAQLLGYKTYADLELENLMALNTKNVEKFIEGIHTKARKKSLIEFQQFTKVLPASVTLTAKGELNPWDVTYLKNQYKKSTLKLDENLVAEYFPVQSTIDSLLLVYEKFFNLSFKQLPAHGLWDADVRLIEVIDNTIKRTIGYLFLDLFPRPNKYNHACENTIIPVTYDAQGNPNIGVAIVIANFPKPRADKPALMLFKDVTTFFHEFGHAMHALLGRTPLASFSGTQVKWDFVEMPSQMLEEWLLDTEIIAMVSKHYKTGQPLPNDLVEAILKSRTYDSGFYVDRQLYLAQLALKLFNNGPAVDIDATLKEVFNEYLYRIQFDAHDHFYASFGHLTGYGSRYYGYMWSKVFAHDLFNAIKKEGLLNPVVGRCYVDAVIGKGGSKDPNDMLKDFLGRAPNQDAFLHDLGLI